MNGFDPNKLDPKLLMELSRLVQQLPPEQVNRMQMLMHNMMAGYDVRKEMEEFERSLPPDFRDKLTGIMGTQTAAAMPVPAVKPDPVSMDLHEARLTILRAVAEGRVSPEEAEGLLFKDSP